MIVILLSKSKKSLCGFDPGTAQHSIRRKFSVLNHSTISSPPKKGVQSPSAFICFTSHWTNLMYTNGFYTHPNMYMNQSYIIYITYMYIIYAVIYIYIIMHDCDHVSGCSWFFQETQVYAEGSPHKLWVLESSMPILR